MKRIVSWRRPLLVAALACVPAAVAVAARPGHTQDTGYQGGLWRTASGDYWCGGTCNASIRQVCCTISINES